MRIINNCLTLYQKYHNEAVTCAVRSCTRSSPKNHAKESGSSIPLLVALLNVLLTFQNFNYDSGAIFFWHSQTNPPFRTTEYVQDFVCKITSSFKISRVFPYGWKTVSWQKHRFALRMRSSHQLSPDFIVWGAWRGYGSMYL